MIPPMMHQTATDRMASPSMPSRVPHRCTRKTETATAMNVNRPCHDNTRPPKPARIGFMPIVMVAKIPMEKLSIY